MFPSPGATISLMQRVKEASSYAASGPARPLEGGQVGFGRRSHGYSRAPFRTPERGPSRKRPIRLAGGWSLSFAERREGEGRGGTAANIFFRPWLSSTVTGGRGRNLARSVSHWTTRPICGPRAKGRPRPLSANGLPGFLPDANPVPSVNGRSSASPESRGRPPGCPKPNRRASVRIGKADQGSGCRSAKPAPTRDSRSPGTLPGRIWPPPIIEATKGPPSTVVRLSGLRAIAFPPGGPGRELAEIR